MNRARRRLCALTLLAPGLVATGCFFPFAYPKWSFVPSCDLGPEVNDIHAFRVDVTADNGLFRSERGVYTVAEITPNPNGTIPAQSRITMERGFDILQQIGRLHDTRVRLYRPGYQLVELHSWESPDAIEWRQATDWRDQERAIDDLLARPALTPTFARNNQERPLPPVTLGESRTFVFASAEYERLATLAPTPADAARVRDKAHRLVEVKPAAGSTPGSP